jgi:hypothetical protein
LSCYALTGLTDADGHGKGRMTPLPYQPADLVLKLQDDHALWITSYQRQQLLGELERNRLLPMRAADIIA